MVFIGLWMEIQMREEARIKRITDKIAKLWSLSPDWRFGQFLINYGFCSDTFDVWSGEDDIIEQGLDRVIKKLTKKEVKKK